MPATLTNTGITFSDGTTLNSTPFPSGTLMLFQQTSAPTGWTKQTTHNDKALRVVSGTASSGGTSAFSTCFQNQTPTINTSGLSAGATTLSTAQMPSHAHNVGVRDGSTVAGPAAVASDNSVYYSPSSYYRPTAGGGVVSNFYTENNGGGGSHTHSVSGSASASAITLNVQYVDLIIASKN